MACTSPIAAHSLGRADDGSQSIAMGFNPQWEGETFLLPCRNCLSCRLRHSKMWAARCLHELQTTKQKGLGSAFITLTYNDECQPLDGGLRPKEFQLFLKRLRKKIAPQKIRYFHCGEYGEQLQRPHYHALIFGFDFPDQYAFSQINGIPLNRSPLLEKLWPYGFSTIGEVTPESCAYVARYILKKQNGKHSDDHYMIDHPFTGQQVMRHKEYITMSRKPGIGSEWFDQYGADIYPGDELIIEGNHYPVPEYYDAKYGALSPMHLSALKMQRKAAHKPDPDKFARDKIKDKVLKLKTDKLVRTLQELEQNA